MRLRHTLTGHSSKVLAAKFMSEKTKVCTGSHDRTIRVWDLRSKACISTFLPASSCNDLVCLDNLIISGHFDKKIRIYDTRSGPQPTSEIQCNGRITSVDLSRTGQNLLACTRDDSLVLMDLRLASAPPVEYRDENFKVGCDWTRAVFTPDSEYVSVGSGDGSVYIWNVRNPNRPETVLKEHSNVVVAVAWQPAGNCVTTCDKGKEVIVWADI